MSALFYTFAKCLTRFSFAASMRSRYLGSDHALRDDAFILACTHLSHIEPAYISAFLPRRVDWMSRIEFYKYLPGRLALDALHAFPVDRFGVPVSTIREGIRRLGDGRIVGIFPEGGVARGSASVCKGGPIKLGACVLALRTGRPIVPCVILGTHQMTRIQPWLPFRRGRIWTAFGPAISPSNFPGHRRAARFALGTALSAGFQSLYQQLLQTYHLDDSVL